MEIDVNALMNYGAMGICLGYFIVKDRENQKNYRDLFSTTVKDFGETLADVKEILVILRENVCNGERCRKEEA